jgi:hypothetical protein
VTSQPKQGKRKFGYCSNHLAHKRHTTSVESVRPCGVTRASCHDVLEMLNLGHASFRESRASISEMFAQVCAKRLSRCLLELRCHDK